MSGLWQRRYEILHHALLAATIAAATVALEGTAVFRGVDVATRAVVSQIQAAGVEHQRRDLEASGFRTQYSPEAAGDRPLTLMVPQAFGQAMMRQTSQADFEAELIRALADEEPRLLALDLELEPIIDPPPPDTGPSAAPEIREADSPASAQPATDELRIGGGSPPGLETDRQRLNDAIRYAAQRAPIVLTAPGPLPPNAAEFREWARRAPESAKQLFLSRLSWMWEMCQIPNVWMALRRPYAADDLYVYSRKTANLGNVATSALGYLQSEASVKVTDVCAVLRRSASRTTPKDLEQFRNIFDRLTLLNETSSLAEASSLNPKFYETLSYSAVLDTRGAAPMPLTALLPPGLNGRVVFVGEAVGSYKTLLPGIVPTIDAEAAIFYSNTHAINTLSEILGFLIDLAIGIVLAFLFTWSWGAYARATDRMDQIPLASWGGKAKAWAWARLVLLPGNLVLLLLLVAASLWVPDELLRFGAWINPLPLVLGMSLKGLLGSRQRHVGHRPQSLGELVTYHPDVVWQPFLIVLALAGTAALH